MPQKISNIIGYTALLLLIAASVYSAEPRQPKTLSYTLVPITDQTTTPIAINDNDVVLVERQLVAQAQAAPLLINKRGKESPPWQCPGTVNDTVGENLNNLNQIVGHCGHQPGFTTMAFVANPLTGAYRLLAFPGAAATWGFGVNDAGSVIGFYSNPTHALDSHGFVWDSVNGYRTLDLPFLNGGPTRLLGINNAGAVVGFTYTDLLVDFEVHSWIYEGGTFTTIQHPDAFDELSTFIQGFNNNGQIFGSYEGPGCFQSGSCLFSWDDGKFSPVTLPVPDNALRPDGVATKATIFGLQGYNDNQEFIGTYFQTLTWKLNEYGDYVSATFNLVDFIAKPVKGGR